MATVLAALVLHVAMGATWLLATLVVAWRGHARPIWLKLMLAVAMANMLAGIDLWHALHSGPWGKPEHLLAVGTFCAFVALGMQAPVAFTLPGDMRRLERGPLAVYRVSAVFVVAAATAMIASRYA